MKLVATGLLFVPTILVVFNATTFGHHSIAAEFDAKRTVTLTGTLTRIEWINPHAFLFVNVKDSASGNAVDWVCELASPTTLIRLGWTQNKLKAGMTLTLSGILARDGSHKMNARSALVDGTELIAWPGKNR